MMVRTRHTIAALMALVLGVGLGLAALRNADPYWAAGTYNVAFFTLSSAAVCALVSKGNLRSVSIGFAVFGLMYLLFDLLPPRPVNIFGFGPQPRPSMLLDQAFVLLQPYLKPMPPFDMQGFTHYDQVAQSIGMFLSGLFGAALSRLVAGNREADDLTRD
jgi:hypothetical protein